MTFRIPLGGKFSQLNKGDISGNLGGSLNLDLKSNPGRLKLSPRMKVLTKDNDAQITSSANFGVPIAFIGIDAGSATTATLAVTAIGAFGANGTGKIFANTGIDFSTFDDLAGGFATNEPTTINLDLSDAVLWSEAGTGEGIYVSIRTAGAHDIAKLDISGPTWDLDWYTAVAGGSFTSNPTLINMWVGFNGNLYVCDVDRVTNVQYSDGLADLTGVGTVDTANKYRVIWGMSNSNRNWICLMTWLGSTSTAGNEGYIAEWDGTGTAFNQLHKLEAPSAMAGIIYEDIPYVIDAYGILKKFNGSAFTEVARLPVANLNIDMPGTRSVFSNNRWIHPRGMAVIDGKINILVNNLVSTGVYVESMPSGIWEYDPRNPSLGLYHKHSPCADTTDWGQQAIAGVGALSPLKTSAGHFMAGVSYYTDDATTNRKAIFYDDVLTGTDKRGSFTTNFLDSENLKDTFQKVAYRTDLLASGDKIVSKYKTKKSTYFPFIASATWTSTTTFTSTDTDFANVTGGEEVEPVMGKSASTTAHVSSISYANPTYTVTLDEAIGQSSGTFKVKMDNFKLITRFTKQDTEQDAVIPSGIDTKIQVKTEIRASDDFELQDLTIINEVGQKIA